MSNTAIKGNESDMSNTEEFSMPNVHNISKKDAPQSSSENGEADNVEMNQAHSSKPQFEVEQKDNAQKPTETKSDTVNEPTKRTSRFLRSGKKESKPTMSNGKQIVKRIFLAGLTVIGIGAGYMYVEANGYVTIIANSIKGEQVTSEMDLTQNDQLTKLNLRAGDISGEIDELKNLVEQYQQTNETERKKIKTLITSLEDTLNSTKSSLTAQLDEFEQGLISSNNLIKSQSDVIAKNKLTASQAKAISEANVARLKNLRTTLGSLEERLKGDIRQIQSTATSNSPSKQTKEKQPESQPTKPVVKKDVYTYAGLRFQSSFDWSNEKVAIVTDGTNSSFQLTVGQKLGDAEVTAIYNNNMEIRLFDGQVLNLIRGEK
ncbi:hypothetical protein HUO09_17510 [Vibrio sp. Y2-5]|uniref:hypothetical protein n=1 Tax=Vibrio sp. Y2-5 TaxID=2743977 RepID=UPI001660DEDC|nr:hypothetical protein [Vibrio sp. Y2-5]MBD0788155.1 hypothetical protein [Vibrio sp. Y2-5]